MKRQASNLTEEITAKEIVSELRKKMSDAGFDEQYLKDFFADPLKINALIRSFQLDTVSTEDDWEKIGILPGRSSNKIVYLVRADDKISSGFIRHYLVSELTTGGAVLEFVGFDVTEVFARYHDEGNDPEDIKEKLRDIDGVLDLINKNRLKVSSMMYPWNRVISIENLFYRMNKK